MMRNLVIVAVLVLCFSTLTVAQELPQYEFYGVWSYVRADGGNTESSPANGWNLGVTFNINELLAIDIEGSGHYQRYMSYGALYEFWDAPVTLGNGEYYETQEEVNHILDPLTRGVQNPDVPWVSSATADVGTRRALQDFGLVAASRPVSSRAHSVAFGPRVTIRDNERYQPFFHVMFGLKHTAVDVFYAEYPDWYRSLTDEELAPLDDALAVGDITNEEYDQIVDAGILVPANDVYDSDVTDNIMLVFGGGMDIVINDKWSVRAFQTDYVLEKQRGDFRPDLSFGTGIVYKLGEK